MFRRCWQWLSRRRPLAEVEVVLYTRRNCPLCDEAHAFLHDEQRHGLFRLLRRDVDDSTVTRLQFGDDVPVVVVNGQVRFRGRINPILWRRLIQSLAR